MASDTVPVDPALEELCEYLRERASDGEFYCKSKFIADDFDHTPREIGAMLATLRTAETGLTIERWAYTNATTWRVTVDPDDAPTTNGDMNSNPTVQRD